MQESGAQGSASSVPPAGGGGGGGGGGTDAPHQADFDVWQTTQKWCVSIGFSLECMPLVGLQPGSDSCSAALVYEALSYYEVYENLSYCEQYEAFSY